MHFISPNVPIVSIYISKNNYFATLYKDLAWTFCKSESRKCIMYHGLALATALLEVAAINPAPHHNLGNFLTFRLSVIVVTVSNHILRVSGPL